MQVSDKMDPKELVKLCETLNPHNKPGRLTIITRMGADNMRVKLPHLIKAVRQAGLIVTWVSDPMHGNTIKAPSGLKTRPFDAIRVRTQPFSASGPRLHLQNTPEGSFALLPSIFTLQLKMEQSFTSIMIPTLTASSPRLDLSRNLLTFSSLNSTLLISFHKGIACL